MSPYSLAVKQEAVRKTLHRESGRTIAQMADELNVPYHSLRKWLQDFRMSEPTAPQPPEKRASRPPNNEKGDCVSIVPDYS